MARHGPRVRGPWFVASFAALLVAAAPGLALAANQQVGASFREDGPGGANDNQGGHAHWNDEQWTIDCPNSVGDSSKVEQLLFAKNSSGDIVTIGWRKIKIRGSSGCTLTSEHFWRWYLTSGPYCDPGPPCGNQGALPDDPDPNLHEYAVLVKSTTCNAGITWCWDFRINDQNRGKTCCGDVASVHQMDWVVTGVYCYWDGSDSSDCPNDGLVDPDNQLQRRLSDGSGWADWNGQDCGLAWPARKVYGKWNSDTSVKASVGTSISGSVGTTC